MNVKWEFEINPFARSWWDSFVDSHYDGDVIITVDQEDHGRFYGISSIHFDELDDATEVWQRAYALKSMFDACMYLTHDDFKPFSLGELHHQQKKYYPAPERNVFAEPYSPNLCLDKYKNSEKPLENSVSRWLYTARFDPLSKNLLLMLGTQGLTYVSLYSALDYMKTAGWDDNKLVSTGKITKADIKLFTHTANTPSAAGPLARHGEKNWTPPSSPMLLTDAIPLFCRLIGTFLNIRTATYASVS